MSNHWLRPSLSILLSLAVTFQAPMTMAQSPSKKIYAESPVDAQGNQRVSYYLNSKTSDGRIVKKLGTRHQDGSITWDRDVVERKAPTEKEVHRKATVRESHAHSPSQLGKALEWSSEKSEMVRQQLERYRLYRENKKAYSTREMQTAESNVKSTPALQMTGNVAAFYLALGIAAGINLLIFHSDDPMAWDNYLNQLTDPVGYASILGFMAAAGMVYKLIPAKTFKGQIGVFGLSMVAGSIVGDLVYDFASDPDTRRCLGFSSVAGFAPVTAGGLIYQNNSPIVKRSLESCDKAFNKWMKNPGKMMDSLAPGVARIATDGVFYLAIANGYMKYIKPIIQGGMRLPKAPVGGVVSVAFNVLLFFMIDWAQEAVIGMSDLTTKAILANTPFSSDEYGTSISQAERNLFKQWKQVKLNGFKDKDKFIGTLERYDDLQTKWRQQLISRANNSYGNWLGKVSDYESMVSYSYQIYKDAVSVTRDHLNGSRIDLKQQIANERERQMTPPPSLSYSTAHFFPGIHTANPLDFAVVSMACGPDGEYTPTSLDGWLEWLGLSPNLMIEDPLGEATRFHPPQITRPDENVCRQYPVPGPSAYAAGRAPSPYYAYVSISDAKLRSNNGTNYNNFIDYISNNLRPSVLELVGHRGTDRQWKFQFDDWWTKHVQPQTDVVSNEFRRQFLEMLKNNLYPVVNDKTYRWKYCKSSQEADEAGINLWIKDLGSNLDDCPADSTHRLANGLMNAYKDSLRLYLALYLELLYSNQKEMFPDTKISDEDFANRYTSSAQTMLSLVDEAKSYLSTLTLDKSKSESIGLGLKGAFLLLDPNIKDLSENSLDQAISDSSDAFRETRLSETRKIAELLREAIWNTTTQISDNLQILKLGKIEL